MGKHVRDKLSDIKIRALSRKAGMYSDGGGLWLIVQSATSRSWAFRYSSNYRSHEMGLGSYPDRTLANARTLALECRQSLQDGIDPIEQRKAAKAAQLAAAAKALTFKEAAEKYIAGNEAAWRNAKHAAQWKSTLATYAYPVFGDLGVAEIDTRLVLKVIEPLWAEKPETASRVRGRIEAVLDWAKVRRHRSGENPARWKGHLDHVLPAKTKVRRVEHHAALAFADLAAFMSELRARRDMSARCLEFTILTAARTGEAIGAAWGEINLDAKVWTVPAERMKAAKEHKVPLSDRAVDLLRAIKPEDGEPDGFVFHGGKIGRPLSNMAMLQLLRRMDRADLTVHGFRSTFSTWARERTNAQRGVVEMALAHTIGNAAEAAYQRGDLFEKRRVLMDMWAKSCEVAPTSNVVPMQREAV